MLKYIFNDKFIAKITDKITSSIEKSFDSYTSEQNKTLNEISENVQKLRIELKSLDQRLTQKELKDRAEYGHVRYQLNSMQSTIRPKKRKEDGSSH